MEKTDGIFDVLSEINRYLVLTPSEGLQEVTAILLRHYHPSLLRCSISLFALLNWAANSLILTLLVKQDPKHRHWFSCTQTVFGCTWARAEWQEVATR